MFMFSKSGTETSVPLLFLSYMPDVLQCINISYRLCIQWILLYNTLYKLLSLCLIIVKDCCLYGVCYDLHVSLICTSCGNGWCSKSYSACYKRGLRSRFGTVFLFAVI